MPMKSLSVVQRLSFLVVVFSLILIAVGVMGMKSSSDTLDGLKAVYEDRTIALMKLTPVVRSVREVLSHLALSAQHAPDSPMRVLHDHSLDVHTQAMQEGLRFIDTQWKTYVATIHDADERKQAEQVGQLLKDFEQNGVSPALALIQKGDFSITSLGPFFVKALRLSNELREPMIHLGQIQADGAKLVYEQALARYQSTRTTLTLIIVLGVLCGSIFAWQLIRSITRPLNEMRDLITRVQQSHDFTLKIPLDARDEIGQTGHSFNDLLGNMRTSLGDMQAMISQVGSAAGELSQNSQQAARAASDASEATSSMAAAVEEITVSINHVGESSREALSLATQAGEYSRQGGEVIRRAIGEINAIAATAHGISQTIAQLGEHSQHISGVIQVIKDVADQTNLLALNAAIEAARAGESGRGFAVVADEVRKLAERTAHATGEISQTVTAIQNSTHDAVKAMEQAVVQVDNGVHLASQAGESITQIGESTAQVVQVVNAISDSILEQASASNAISSQVERVAQASEENSAVAHSSANSAQQVARLSEQMRQTAGQFHI